MWIEYFLIILVELSRIYCECKAINAIKTFELFMLHLFVQNELSNTKNTIKIVQK